MISNEKVIAGLHCCSHTDGACCIDCPYDISGSDCTALMAMDVLDLLKEQQKLIDEITQRRANNGAFD